MAFTFPASPSSFQDPALSGLVAALQAGGPGKLALISGTIDSFTGSWSHCGVDNAGIKGDQVLATASLGSITGPLDATQEGTTGEFGRKLTFAAVNAVPITTTGVATGLVLMPDVADSTGVDADIRYIVDMNDLSVSASNSINLPTFDIEIFPAENY